MALQIPAPTRVEDDVIVYPRVQGQALDRLTLTRMSALERQRLAAELGTFLA